MKQILSLIISTTLLFCVVGCASTLDPVSVVESESEVQSVTEEIVEKPQVESTQIDVSIVGDLLLAGGINNLFDTCGYEYFLAGVKDIFEKDDFTLGNLENVISDKELTKRSKSGDRVFWFKGPKKNLNILKSGYVEYVSLSNNHTGDYGLTGLSDTISALEGYEIEYGTNSKIMYYTKKCGDKDFTIAIICHGLWSASQTNSIISLLEEANKKSDFQIVYYHGGTEKIHAPEKWKVVSSHKLVNAGADLVIGNHPHVLQPLEVYNGVDIIYSIGNFCYGGSRRPENATIIYKLYLDIELTDDNFKVIKNSEILPCYVYKNDYQPCLMEKNSEDYNKVISFMNSYSNVGLS